VKQSEVRMDRLYAEALGAKYQRVYTSFVFKGKVTLSRLNNVTFSFICHSDPEKPPIFAFNSNLTNPVKQVCRNVLFNEIFKYRNLLENIKPIIVLDLTCDFCKYAIEDVGNELNCGHIYHSECLFSGLNKSTEFRCATCNAMIV
jgi:hypothetical protein